MGQPILCLSRRDIEEILTFDEVVKVVEAAFTDYQMGRTKSFPVVRERIVPHNGVFGVKSGYLQTNDTVGLKAGGFWGERVAAQLPGHYSTIILFDPGLGHVISLMDGNYITELRTAAAGAVAARFLVRKDLVTYNIGLIGAGVQGRGQLAGLLRTIKANEVRVYDVKAPSPEIWAAFGEEHGTKVTIVETAHQAVIDSDVVITATPSTQPIVQQKWIRPGIHINAMGSDTKGKQELETAVLGGAKIVVDNLSQARELGECQHGFANGSLSENNIYAELGEITAGMKPGRTDNHEITIFDGTGVSFQDLATARLVLDRARERQIGTLVNL
ncbi:MAG: ornithine cyclodeaminase family protein [Chloroflexi bacterium]|nr:ornithine cyclodeaminase family protein [Chloroflexota bacterium]